jgi:predicted nucleic-acid-binding Zn-ribbon protein
MTEKKEDSRQCVACGSTNLDYGHIATTPVIESVLETLETPSGVSAFYCSNADRARAYLFCSACLKCGHIELHLDPKQIKHYREYPKK